MANRPSDDRFFEDEGLNTYTPIPACAQLKRMWRRSDMYALPITLRYKGEKSFYTNFGALSSCIVMFTMLLFTLTYLNAMVRDQKQFSSYTEKLAYLKPET
jgi:hypothetical protein